MREAVGLTTFGTEGDETPIQIVPDLVLEDREPEPATAAAGGKPSKARNGNG